MFDAARRALFRPARTWRFGFGAAKPMNNDNIELHSSLFVNI